MAIFHEIGQLGGIFCVDALPKIRARNAPKPDLGHPFPRVWETTFCDPIDGGTGKKDCWDNLLQRVKRSKDQMELECYLERIIVDVIYNCFRKEMEEILGLKVLQRVHSVFFLSRAFSCSNDDDHSHSLWKWNLPWVQMQLVLNCNKL